MSLTFKLITSNNVDDLLSICGNLPGLDTTAGFAEGRKARREWVTEMAEKLGAIGMIAYNESGKARGFVECIPATIHPLGKYSQCPEETLTIDCAWYKHDDGQEPSGLPVRKAILMEMVRMNAFDTILGRPCRYVDVLALKNPHMMQYDFYEAFGFKESLAITGGATVRYLMRLPLRGDVVIPGTEVIDLGCDAGKNVLVIGVYRQCYEPFILAEKVKNAVKDIDGLSVKVIDYWATGMPPMCDATINGQKAFEGSLFMMDEKAIKEAVIAKMCRPATI